VISGSPTPDDSKVLDLDHLRRQTAGDGALERELLALFEAQCARLWPLVRGAGVSPLEQADAAHTLKGSARAVGAWRLASTVDRLEIAFRNGAAQAEMTGLLAGFDEALEATREALGGPGPATAA